MAKVYRIIVCSKDIQPNTKRKAANPPYEYSRQREKANIYQVLI
jgi:hypothetical protein